MASDTSPAGLPVLRHLRHLRTLALALCVVLLVLLVAGTWLFATEGGARTAFSLLRQASGNSVQIAGVAGTLAGPLRLHQVIIDREDQQFVLDDVALDWHPGALLRNRFHVTTLRVRHLRATSKMQQDDTPTALPDRIDLPLRLQVDSVEIGGGDIAWGPLALIQLGAFGFNLDFDGERYRFRLDRFAARSAAGANAFSGKFSGQATLSTTKPYALHAAFSSGGEAVIAQREIGAAGRFDLSGSLADMAASIDLVINQSPVKGNLVLHPFSENVLGSAHVTAHSLDLSAFRPDLPKTALDISLSAAPHGLGELSVSNSLAGPYDAGQIPLQTLAIDFRQDDGHFTFDRIAATLGSAGKPAGTISGNGSLASGALALALQTANLDLQRLDRRLRKTSLTGAVTVEHEGGKQSLVIALSEPLKKNNLTLNARAVLSDQHIEIDSLDLRAGSSLLAATARVELAGRQRFEAKGTLNRFQWHNFGDFPQLPALDLNGGFNLSGMRSPALQGDLAFTIKDSKLAGHTLAGDGQVQLRGDSIVVPKLVLAAGTNRLSAQGRLATGNSRVDFTLQAPALEQLGQGFGGRLDLTGNLSGTMQRPRLLADWKASAIRAPGQVRIESMQGNADVQLDRARRFMLDNAIANVTAHDMRSGEHHVADTSASVQFSPQPNAPLAISVRASGIDSAQLKAERFDANVNGTTATHTAIATLVETAQKWQLNARGGFDLKNDPRWSGKLERLDASGRFNAALAGPATLEVAQQRVQLDNFRLNANSVQVVVEQFLSQPDRLTTRGRFERLQVGELLRYIEPAPSISADLQLAGEWDLDFSREINGKFSIRRQGGDVSMQGNTPVTLGLHELAANAIVSNGRLAVQLKAAGEKLGQIDVSGATTLGGGDTRFSIAQDAAVSGSATINVPALGWVGPMVSPTTVAEGSLQSALTLAGTFGKPRLAGQINSDALRLHFTDTGVDLRQGVLRSEFQDDRLLIRELSFRNGGTLAVSGPIQFSGGKMALQLTLLAERYKLIARSDRRLTISGKNSIALGDDRVQANGALRIDEGFFDIGSADTPQLSDDVVVVGRSQKGGTKTAIALDLDVALGDGVAVRGRGLDATVGGEIHLSSAADKSLRAQGTLRVIKGTFAAYGRELAIEQGLLRFNGPLNNPGLDIVAMRRGQEVEAGVAVRGNVLAPRITLVSEPNVADAEKLSWLVLGRSLSGAGATEMGALQDAAGALLAQGAAAGLQSQIATAFGLDDFSVGSGGTNLQERIVKLGKQISARLYVSYQQSLESATSVLLLRYTLTPRITVEAEAGTRSALSMFYNFAFD